MKITKQKVEAELWWLLLTSMAENNINHNMCALNLSSTGTFVYSLHAESKTF